MSDRERRVKDEAYRIWDAAGRPEGRDDEHWFEAEKRIASDEGEPAPAKAKKTKIVTPVVKNAGNAGVVAPVVVVEPKPAKEPKAKEPRLKKGDVVDIVPTKGKKPKDDKKPEKPARPKSKA